MTWSPFGHITAAAVLLLCLMPLGGAGTPADAQHVKEIIYVGTYSGRGSRGLYVFAFDRATGQMTGIQTVSDRKGPNFQALHPDGTYLYSVSGAAYSDETDHGTVTAYRIDPETGLLTQINEQSTQGRGPAHVSVDPRGRFVYVSNFSSGNLSVFAINEDGSLTEAVDVVRHEGSSINERRQSGPHVHSIVPSPDGRYIYVSDMGIDKIMIYAVDQNTGELTPAEMPYVESIPGSGPRHFTIHPNDKFAYSLEQISSTVAVYRVNQSTGALTRIQRMSTLPDAFEGANQAADIHISPDGEFLYASNRGHNSLVIYKIDRATGKLSLIDHEPTRGRHPRNFMVDEKGEFVLVANMYDDEVVIFRRDQETGKLNYTGEQVHVPMAVCVTQHFLI